MNNNQKAARDNRRYKYGSLSAVFTVVFIALILVVNLVFSSLSISGKLTVDLTPEEFTNVSDETVSLLTDLGEDLKVTIYFMSARDTFDLDQFSYNGINIFGICRDLAENYANIFDGSGDKGTIEVVYKELHTDPDFERKYLETTGSVLTQTSVIIDGVYHDRVLDLSNFYTMENGVPISFRGESRLTAAILRSSISEMPVVTFTYGNGEPFNADGTLKEKASGIVSLFTDAGFEVKATDISVEEIDPRTEILITYAPNIDFDYTEIDVLQEFVKARNSYMVFVDADTPQLPNLQSYLNEYWGLNYKAGNRVTDGIHSLNNKSSSVISMKPEVDRGSEDGSASYQLRKTVYDFEGAINTLFPESVELEANYGAESEGVIIEKVLTTYETAVSQNVQSGDKNEGEMPLMLLSSAWGYGENDTKLFSYVALVGSTDFASADNLEGTYGNRRVMLSAARIFGSDNVAVDVPVKALGSTALDIESGTAKTFTWLICTILPGAIMIFGIVVYFRRRHL